MPAKRAIIMNYDALSQRYNAVVWADVPVGNQIAYADPAATSAYENISPTELQAIRDGVVAEKLVSYAENSGAVSLANMEAWLQAEQTAFQAAVTAATGWANYGRYWNGAAWVGTTGVPMVNARESVEGPPTFVAVSPVSAFGANKFHFVLHNNAAIATAAGLVAKVRLVVAQPVVTVVVGVQPGVWTLRRRDDPTTAPSGAGSFAPGRFDSVQTLPSGIACYNAPAVSPAGGTLSTINQWIQPADEIALSTLNAPGMASLLEWGGIAVYRPMPGIKPLAIRPGQTLEVQQDATAGTGNCRIVCVFTVG